MTDLLLSRGSTKYKEQVQKLLESQPAVKKDRAGELALVNSFLGLPWTRSCLPARGAGPAQKPGGGAGPGWNGPGGGRLRPEKRGRPGNSKNATLPARESFFFCIFFAFFVLHVFCIFMFCISQTFFAFPRLGVIFCHFFCISQTESHFLHFFCIS